MKQILYSILILLSLNLGAQNCPQGNYTLATQADVTALAVDLASCNTITGNLTIQSNTNLDLTGLSNLITVDGEFAIQFSPSLSSLSGLNNLDLVGEFLIIRNNPSLSSLSSLNNLTSVDGFLELANNMSLNSLVGLENLNSVGGSLTIQNNSSLSSLSGLENLSSLVEHLTIRDNSNLSSLSGIENLTSVGGGLDIGNNSSLLSLVGLENLTSLVEHLSIIDNSNLSSLSGLDNLISIGGYLQIEDNSSLSDCCIILPVLDNVGTSITINNNAISGNCNSQQDIENAGACPNVSLSQLDENGDGSPDITDPCSCADPLNTVGSDGIVDYFHDFILVNGDAPGETWQIDAGHIGILNSNGTPYSTDLGGNIPLPEVSPGVYRIDFWHTAGTGFSNAVASRTAGGTVFSFTALMNSCVACAQTPSLGQWGIILLSLLLLSLGLVYVTAPKLVLSNGQRISQKLSWKTLPRFSFKAYFLYFALILLSILSGFLAAYGLFDYEVTNADPFGIIMASGIIAYMIMILKRNGGLEKLNKLV